MLTERRWKKALAEHAAVVHDCVAQCERVLPVDWQRAPSNGKWSPAAVMLHICQSYEIGRDAVLEGRSMRLRVKPSRAWLWRTFLLPVILATRRFPRGVKAPREVVPDAMESDGLTRDAAVARLTRVSAEAAIALRHAAGQRAAPSMTHAYFGPLAPLTTMRLLNAHTRHHTQSLARLTDDRAPA